LAVTTWQCEKVRINGTRSGGNSSAVDARPIEFSSSADRIGVIGAPRELMLAAAGLAPVDAGTIHIVGQSPIEAQAQNRIAVARMDATVPETLTIIEYLSISARLASTSHSDAKAKVRTTLETFALTSVETRSVKSMPTHVQHAVKIAAAHATGAALLLIDDPLAGLPADSRDALGRILKAALRDVQWVLFADAARPGSELWDAVEECVVFRSGEFVAHATMDELRRSRAVSVTVAGDREAFAAALKLLDVRAEPRSSGTWVVDLGTRETARVLFEAAASAGAYVIDMSPLFVPAPE
jgi:ABC-type multidrug transport system ATPase subunit